MKKVLSITIAIIIFISCCGCNEEQRADLQNVIDLEIGEEASYTTSSYEHYLSARENAQSVVSNSFATTTAINEAKQQLRSAHNNLKEATKGVYRIEYEFTMVSNHSVGNSWNNKVMYNGRKLNNGDTVTATLNSEITLQGIATENDSIPDTEDCFVTLPLKDGMVGTGQITVTENRGRYSGNTAIWNVTYSITLIRLL